MIIKHPAPHHKESQIALWMEAFDEPKESPETFFATAFSPDRSMVCEEDNQAVAALYWFDCLWGDKKVAYIYAVATLLSHRGQGFCNKLMQKTHEILKERNYHGAILVPAEDSLFGFYEKMGYIPCVPQEMQNAQCKMQNAPISVAEYQKLQKTLLPQNAILHTDTAFLYLSNFARFYKTEKGIFCETEDEIQEVLPYSPSGKNTAMYLPLTEDKTLPSYFGLPLA